ncbi:tripartite motif-containing protein 66 [Chanos chanos]|uniref:Tripartite motif-containing protein 66 n=1 Tax=Chanos chanos TaxID=29144 RepID=A0A6J2UNZ7_CHACN|nr:tripartite motif-containing protein 66 [Chanos chanos]
MEKCCSECPEPRVAQSLCTFCNKWLCFQCTDMHQHERPSTHTADLNLQQRTSSPPLPSETGGSGSCVRTVMCSLHKQEPLELFCETCDLMACSICHLSSHKDHRLVHVGKALHDQAWLFENLMARVEEKRSAVENQAKQIQGRLHGVKITQRKAENQIKMAKMIMMNELNKRANLLIEQLESISSSFKQRLEEQLQGAIELCSQLDHIQNFITWATAHHRRSPLLFSKELIALQLQHLLEPLIHSDSWVPLKIRFNWDASFWTKQISNLGQLSVTGGGHAYTDGAGRPGILRPQPVTCRSLPSLCHTMRDQGCAFQAYCQPQVCCLHCVPTQGLPTVQLDKPLREQNCSVRCSQTSCGSPPLNKRWDPQGPSLLLPSTGQRLQQVTNLPVTSSIQLSPSSAPGEQLSAQVPARQQDFERVPENPELPQGNGSTREQMPEQTQTGTHMQAHSPQIPREAENSSNREQTRTVELGTKRQAQMQLALVEQLHADCGLSRRSSEVEMHALTQDGSHDAQSRPGPVRRTKSQNSSAELSLPHKSSSKNRLTGATYSPATTAEDGDYAAQQVSKAPVSSKVPVVCLERLKILGSRFPSQIQPPTDPGLKFEGTVLKELERGHITERMSGEDMIREDEDIFSPLQQLPLEHMDHSTSPASLEVPISSEQESYSIESTSLAPSPDPEDTDPELPHTSDQEPSSEPRSVPASDSLVTTEVDPGSEIDLESVFQQESDLQSFESEPQAEGDSDSESEQGAQSADSEADLVSEADSTAEVTIRLDPGSKWEPDQRSLPAVSATEAVCENAATDQPLAEAVEMENEDFCAVCLIGGELLCCDRCPKVYHLSCHVPALQNFPTGDWVCTLCRDVEQPEVEYDCESDQLSTNTASYGLSACDRRKCEKLTLFIYSNILSAPFHEPVSPLARHYYQIIKKPMDLSVIRSKLSKNSHSHYNSPEQFVADILLMFRNCAKFNYSDSEVAQAGRSLEAFFRSKLREVFPELGFSAGQDSDSEECDEMDRPGETGFPWPERREQSHRKRKRRHSLNWRKHQS